MAPGDADSVATFWGQVRKTDTCWLWMGKRQPKGYGYLSVRGKTTLAHRFAWQISTGSLPEGVTLGRRCDEVTCVRPDHYVVIDRAATRDAGTAQQARFWRKVRRTEGCWLWQGATDGRGYGQITIQGRPVKAHRASWEFANGPVAPGATIAHHCDTPLCVRPDHLFVTDAAGNSADCVQKGRMHHGETSGPAKLRLNKVRRVRQLYATGLVTMEELARLMDVTPAAISAIVTGRTWGHE